jgi:hypothetical protein
VRGVSGVRGVIVGDMAASVLRGGVVGGVE